jgi:hypothetical protein
LKIIIEYETIIEQNATPWALLESSYKIIQEELDIQLLNQVKKSTPEFFERLVFNCWLKWVMEALLKKQVRR